MAAKRLPGGTRVQPVRLGLLVEAHRKLRFEQMADHAGISAAVFFEPS